jgi:3-phenylpropionate/trans-cinnamate dioxygenase ferredoxin reductase subunit
VSAGLVIVGGSYAALSIAASAREHGYGGSIRLISDDGHLPYQRPPLSKGFIAGELQGSALPLRAASFFCDKAIEVVTDTQVVRIDRRFRHVGTAAGDTLSYDYLALATGTRARRIAIPGADLEGVLYLRTLEDAIKLQQAATKASRVVIIGGGFIGLEVAAALATRGKHVVILEAQDRLLPRAVGPELSAALLNLHRRRRVVIEHGISVEECRGPDGRVAEVATSDGRVLPADLVLVAIGAVPNAELAAESGLECADGIVVNETAQTSDVCIFAAGDCTRFRSRFASGPVRIESVQNAIDQGKVAGATIAGKPSAYAAVPWFWSDQFDVKLQMTGLFEPGDEAYMRGSEAEHSFSVFYFRDGRIAAVHAFNRPADYMLGRKHLAAGTPLRPKEVCDGALLRGPG